MTGLLDPKSSENTPFLFCIDYCCVSIGHITCLVLFIILEDLMLDGQKDNEVIPAGWKCLLLWQIWILGGAFEQEGSGGGAGGGRGVFIP